MADDAALLESAFRNALARADIVISTGGLGPTEDDLTREAAAAALGRPLHRDPALIEELKARFARFGRVMAPVNEKQADVIEGAVVAAATRAGRRPASASKPAGRLLVLLPGPPHEMRRCSRSRCCPSCASARAARALRTRILKIAAMGESDVEQVVAPVYKTFTNPRTTILGGPGQVELHLTAEGASDGGGGGALEALAAAIRAGCPGASTARTAASCTRWWARCSRSAGSPSPLAESCTGGLVSGAPDRGAGLERLLDRAWVTYANAAKVEDLGRRPALIERHGRRLGGGRARDGRGRARARARADIGVAITGIAGPGGGTPEKPVGLVFIAPQRRGRRPRAPRALPRRPRPRAPPVDAVGAGDDPAGAPRPLARCDRGARAAGRPFAAFVALPLPEARAARRRRDHRVAWRRPLPDVRFVRDEGVHVTLRFLGWTRAETLAALRGAAAAAAAACPPGRHGGARPRPVPGAGRVPASCWSGWRCPRGPAAGGLRDGGGRGRGFEPEPRPFHPHLTLGRWRDRARAGRPLPDADLGTAHVRELVLYRSDIRPLRLRLHSARRLPAGRRGGGVG